MTELHFYEPRDGHASVPGLAHDPLNAIVAPRPIGWISTLAADSTRNLAPYSFFMLFNYRPPILGFSSTGWKDSAANIAATGEFVWNLATRDLAEPMNASAATVAAAVDEFDLAGLEAAPSRLVKPPRVAASPVAFECRHTQTLRLRGADGAELDTWLTLGEVVGIHIAPELIEGGSYRTAAAHPVLRGGGPGDYFEIDENARFEMRRPA
ncbi:flavin reductase family protein [Sphingomonas sp. PAMC 26605]|uniref:flavin reductase family protein n=1 Tax=Sphingomonas sp. PAMC 26605 TaxID=1112214 RepID=UPI00026CD06F|nr:flavin reductase family protein [Sphingomonas sp. PAMC 26605]